VANEWTTLQERYYKDQHEPAKLTLSGQTWMRQLIYFPWDEAFQLWDKRNKEMFENEDENNSTLLFDLKHQVRELYNLEDKVLARDRNNFALPLNEQLTQHPIQLHNYVKIQGPIIRQSVKEAEKAAAARTLQLPTFFPRVSLPKPIAHWPTLRGPPTGLSQLWIGGGQLESVYGGPSVSARP
jgi:hypothetical protein